MRTRSWWEQAVWAGLAISGGAVVAYLDRTTNEGQGTLLLLMVLAFALTLPGRAPVLLVAIASVLPLNVGFLLSAHAWSPAFLFILVPVLIAAAGGQWAGRLLDFAAAQLTPAERSTGLPWYSRPLEQRFLLGAAFVTLAAMGLPMIDTALTAGHATAPTWVAMVWEIMTLLGWIGVAPIVLRERAAMRSAFEARLSLSASDVGMHATVVIALATVHAVAVVTVGQLLLLAPRGDLSRWPALVWAAFTVYLPLDLLAYLTILALGFASDVTANRRQMLAREAALRTEAAESRLDALRARLNPHFLFNALSGVRVLADSGNIERSNEMLAGITKLLRYVLDEHRQTVSLEEELGFARDYLMVQQARFGDRLRFEIVAADSVERAAVPQLLLQPIIENAVEHGVQQLIEGGTVRVRATRRGDRLEIVVENDGPAVSPEGGAHGIGLTSTRERMERLYGSGAELRLESIDQHRGTRVVIRLPFTALSPST